MITVNWATKVISVPKADMTLIQSSPEIRELDLNTFRLTLKDREDDEAGIPFLTTHSHVAPVTVGGVTLARIVELINGYTVTFEDGQYAVNLVGANSNVSEKTNVNQVSIRSANSAGLVQVDTGGTDPLVILDELLSNHNVFGSVGWALRHILGMVQHNYVLDNAVYNAQGFMTSARVRVFETAAQASAATLGGTGEGEIHRCLITAVPGVNNKIQIYKAIDDL